MNISLNVFCVRTRKKRNKKMIFGIRMIKVTMSTERSKNVDVKFY